MADILKFMHCGCEYTFGCGVEPYGDGSDGDCVISQDTTLSTDRSYQFNNLTICSGAKVTFSGTNPVIFKVKNCFRNDGEIYLREPLIGATNSYIEKSLGLRVSNKKNKNYSTAIGIYCDIMNNVNEECIVGKGGKGGDYNVRNVSCCGGAGGAGGDFNGRGCIGCYGYCDGTAKTDVGSGGAGSGDTPGCMNAGGGGGAGSNSYCAGTYSCMNGSAGANCIGGKGGDAHICCDYNYNCYHGSGGGGGWGYCGGGDGGYGGNGGDGGNSYMGNGGTGGCATRYKGGKGGDSVCGNGGKGGDGTCGGAGGNSIYGNGGEGGRGNTCSITNCNHGGNSVYGNGGQGGCTASCWCYAGTGGNSIYGCGGEGGHDSNGSIAGNGGSSVYGNGGVGGTYNCDLSGERNRGGCGMNGGYGFRGGHAWGGHHGLGIFAKIICNTGCINAHGGNGGLGLNWGGAGSDGGDITLVYNESYSNTGCIDLNGGCAGGAQCGTCTGTVGCNGNLTLLQI